MEVTIFTFVRRKQIMLFPTIVNQLILKYAESSFIVLPCFWLDNDLTLNDAKLMIALAPERGLRKLNCFACFLKVML